MNQSAPEGPAADTSFTIVHLLEELRYELRDGAAVIGTLAYRLDAAGTRDLYSTKVDEEYGGRGLAGRLVRFGLDDVRAAGGTVLATCSYVASWIEKHPDYTDLLAG